MEQVNQRTGEVFEVEEATLEKICNGDLAFAFRNELTKLIEQMGAGDKGSINIKIGIYCTTDKDGSIGYQMEADVKTTYPKTRCQDAKFKYLKEDGTVVQRKDKGLFNYEK